MGREKGRKTGRVERKAGKLTLHGGKQEYWLGREEESEEGMSMKLCGQQAAEFPREAITAAAAWK